MSQTYVRTGKTVERKVRDEHVLVPVGGNLHELDSLFTLNETASFIWDLTRQPVTEGRIVESMLAQYDLPAEEARADTQRILTELVEIGAIAPRESDG